MSIVALTGDEKRLPIIRIDGRDYFITGGSYTKLHNEKAFLTEEYTAGGNISRSFVQTYSHRWNMTLRVPLVHTQVQIPSDMSWLLPGDRSYLHASNAKCPPSDLLEYYDVTCQENFSGSESHLVYINLGQEAPHNDDVTIWDIPVTLWGYDAS